jgi:glycosyltransferase involved in cell wall biosynthesis
MAILGAKLEPELFPVSNLTAKYNFRPAAIVVAPGQCYEKLLGECIHGEYHIVFIVPWLMHGGADKEAIDLVNTVCRLTTKTVLVILSEIAESPWRTRLHQNASVLSLDCDFHDLPLSEQMIVLATLIQNVNCAHLHVINSKTGWELVQRFGKALSQNSKISAHLFCESIGERGELYGYGSDYLRSSYPFLTAIFTDSEYMIEQMHRIFAVPRSLFTLLRPGITVSNYVSRTLLDSSRILWAGRLDHQKRPDILLRIAESLPMMYFDVYGRSVLDDTSQINKKLTILPNVTMHGEYEQFTDIVSTRHCAFLYTSDWDGFPNVLVEAANAGLPIIAPAVGGIPEVINESNGFIVKPGSDSETYVEVIKYMLDNYKEATFRAKNLHEEIRSVFNCQLFDRKVAEFF